MFRPPCKRFFRGAKGDYGNACLLWEEAGKMENLLIQFKGGGLAFNVAFRSAKVALPWVGFHEAFGFE